ncbi:ABC transporter permease subunit [Fervidobacterium pennivorans subsp. shakshaketiis]|uniref:ABC transporter permease subunit n=1 Tax=Fervidobacterium pennivorans TaxID=93466 RepID=UPI00355C811B
MTIFKWEFRKNLKSLFIWLVFIISIQFMYSALFPSFAGEGGLFSSKMQLLPKVFLKIFGIEEIDFSNIIHFFAMQGQIWIFLFATFYVMRLASSIIVKEEDAKTVEFVLSRPLSRRQYIFEKILLVTVNTIIYDFIIALALLYMFNAYKIKPFDMKQFWFIVFSYIAVHIFMALIGIISSTVVRKRATADTITVFFLGFFYILSLIGRVYENYAYLKKLTPFGIFDPADIIKSNSFNYKAFVFVILLYLAGAIFSVLYYEKKDIYT